MLALPMLDPQPCRLVQSAGVFFGAAFCRQRTLRSGVPAGLRNRNGQKVTPAW
jgi:hypothetical protein